MVVIFPVTTARGTEDLQKRPRVPDPLHRGRFSASHLGCPMPYFVEGYADDCKLTATAKTAKKAFAEAIDWQVAKQFSAVCISDGKRRYSIAEFSEVMALLEIAGAVR